MTIQKQLLDQMTASGRVADIAEFDDPVLGPLRLLPGTWENTPLLNGFGFNLMALPFNNRPAGPRNMGFRVLMNQYEETLTFAVTDKGVPNRGRQADPSTGRDDQTIVALDYFQKIRQIDSDDFPASGLNERFNGQLIHKEPGLWLHMVDHNTISPQGDINIARLGTIPHGNSFLASGSVPNRKKSPEDEDDFVLIRDPDEADLLQLADNIIPGTNGAPLIPGINGVVVGGGENPEEKDLEPILDDDGNLIIDYFEAYRHFHEAPYQGKIPIKGFSGFEPVHTTDLLVHTLVNVLLPIGKVRRIMRLRVNSAVDHAGVTRTGHNGIVNIPFVVRQADANVMNATFIIYEIEDKKTGKLRHFMQYAQNVILDFIGRPDGHPNRARWPHVSINTMERVEKTVSKELAKALLY